MSGRPLLDRAAHAQPASMRPDPQRLPARQRLAWAAGVAGLLAYNWWALVPLRPGLLRSPDEFFSNLEVAGHPYATAMQLADALSGLLLLLAFLAAGATSLPGGRREWLGMVAFAVGAGLGGLFPQVCTDGVSAPCLRAEWQFELPASQYVHDTVGILEFAAITFTLCCAVARTRDERTSAAGRYRRLAAGAVLAYPFLLAAYLLDRFGGVVEAVFFVGFTALTVTQLAERTRAGQSGQTRQAGRARLLSWQAQLAEAAPSDPGDPGDPASAGSAGAAVRRLPRQRGTP